MVKMYYVQKEDPDVLDEAPINNISSINIEQTSYSISTIVKLLKEESLELSSNMQQVFDEWDSDKKSQLIESMILGIPIQSFFFNIDSLTGHFTIVDGFLRLCAIKDFFLNKKDPLILNNLRYLSRLNGLSWKDISLRDYKRIMHYNVSVNVLSMPVPIEVKYSIFRHIHTFDFDAGRISQQGMRNRMVSGKGLSRVNEMVELQSFKTAVENRIFLDSIDIQEIPLRFIAFYLGAHIYVGYFNLFLDSFLRRLNSFSLEEWNPLLKKFDRTLKICDEIFDDDAFILDGKFNKSLWDCVSVNIAHLSLLERKILLLRKNNFLEKYDKLVNHNLKFKKALTKDPLSKENTIIRFEKMNQIIKEVVA